MLIKEYRIPMPLSVEEYRIAQLYMIAKKSQTESVGKSSGVEIIKNEPYTDEKTGQKGQYTLKNYYVSSLVPSWLKALFNNSVIIEEAWNCYPYTKTIYTCSFSDRFLIEINTHYSDDPGLKENVFKLDETELANCKMDFIDIVRDQPWSNESETEDPLRFVSKKTKRGPLSENWLEECTREYKRCMKNGTKPKNNVMCAYKLCKIKVNVWAAQQRIERFIDDFAKRKVMLSAHRQAWCWQDEWYGLTMEDIRKIELETQRVLNEKMNQDRKSRSSICGEEIFGKKKSKSRQSSVQHTGNDFQIESWRIEKLAQESDESSSEYFTAREDLNSLCKWSSLECVNKNDDETASNDELENTMTNRSSVSKTTNSLSKESLSCPDRKVLSGKRCSYSALIFILHGGHLLDCGTESNNKYFDFSVLESTFQKTMITSYSSLVGRIAFKLICCPFICKSSLQFLSKLSSSYQSNGKFDYETLPIDCLPLFATNLSDYQTQVDKTISTINQTYREFIESEEGKHFNGRISFICDFLGGILGYDSLCNSPDKQIQEPENVDQDKTHQTEIKTNKYDFQVDDFFLFGCPLSLILTYRKLTSNETIQKPQCIQVYNLYYPMDRLVMRIEPLIESKFSDIPSISVPKYNKRIILQQIISIEKHLKFNQKLLADDDETEQSEQKIQSILQGIKECWWGDKRIDYELYCPRGINNFPNNTLPVLFHSSFWESSDVASFVLDKLFYEIDPDHYCRAQKIEDKLICKPKEKWLKKSTSYKIKNISSNHRANDIIVKEGQEQTLTARFIYGPLDMVTLVGEKVDIYLLRDLNKDDWTFLATEFTDKAGRVYHTIQEPLNCGIYPIKMIVRGDHSSIDFFLNILPAHTECVVFSIDGSFAASVSVTGKDPKVRPGAVDVVRFWQEMGYLIIYITGRPGMQQQKVLAWLSDHCFPHGLIYFTGGLTMDPLRHKAMYLQRLQQEVELSIYAAYGSQKDIWVYQSLGLSSNNIFIVGKVSKKQLHLANIIFDGYAVHLEELKSLPGFCRRANNNQITLPRGNFGLCNFTGFCGIRLRRKHRSNRIISHPVPSSTNSTPKLSHKFSPNTLTVSSSTLNSSSFKSTSAYHSPTSNNSNLFTNFFHNRTFSNKSK